MPTGPYQKEKLLKHLEDSAKQERDWDEAVPFSQIKRGRPFSLFALHSSIVAVVVAVRRSAFIGKVYEEKEETVDLLKLKRDEKIPMPIMLDVDSDDDDYERVVDKAMDKAPEKDLVDLAGILVCRFWLNG